MIVLSLTEEDRALLLPLTPEQRDQVFLALLTGAGAGSTWGKMEEETLEAIRRRAARRKQKSEYSKRYYKGHVQNAVQNVVQNTVQNGHPPSPSSPSSAPFLPPSSLPPIIPPLLPLFPHLPGMSHARTKTGFPGFGPPIPGRSENRPPRNRGVGSTPVRS